jgi:Flp pilus assembly protein TadD
MRNARRAASIPALLLLARTAPAATWLKLTSDHFELYTSAGEKKGREAILHFERVHSFFMKALHREDTPLLPPVRIVAFSSEKEYLPYRMNEFAVAYYASEGHRDTIVMRGIGTESYPTAVHEFTHIILGHADAKIPSWLNEGLADLFSTLKPDGKKLQVGDIMPGRLVELREAKWIDLPTLTAVDRDSPYYNEKQRAGIFYAESWALTHMIRLSPDYTRCGAALLAMLLEGKPAAVAFEQACGKSLEAVQTDLEQYVRGTRFYAGVYDIRIEKRAEAPDVAAVSPLESGIVLARVLFLVRQRAESRRRYEELAKKYPQSPEPEEGLAQLDWREHRPQEARRHFARAIELGSRDPYMYFDYAVLERENSALLRKALQLKPGWHEAQYRLGLALVREGAYEEAVELLLRTRITPEQAFPYCYGLAYAYLRLGRQADAASYALEGRAWAKDPADQARLQDLMGSIDAQKPAADRQGR